MKKRTKIKALFSKVRVALVGEKQKDQAMIALFSLLTVIILAGTVCNGYAATTGAEFQGVYDLFFGWAEGFLGKSIMIAAFIIGLGSIVFRQFIGLVVAIVAAVAVSLGPGILESIATATF